MKYLMALMLIGLAPYVSIGAATAPSSHVGSYSVPVPTDLAPYASYPNTFHVSTTEDGKLRLQYRLPPELVGNTTTQIDLVQTSDDSGDLLTLESSAGDTATCRKDSAALTCFVLYPGLATDLNGVKTILQQETSDPVTLKHRMEVARAFGFDPKGIAYCPLSSSAD